MGKPIWANGQITMTVHNYKLRQVHKTLNGLNPSRIFRDMRSAKSGSDLCQIWKVFGPWASPYGSNGQMTMTVHNYRPRKFHRTSNHEKSVKRLKRYGFCKSGSRPPSRLPACPPARPPARTVTIPLQTGGLRGKKGFWLAAHNRGAPEFNTLEQKLYK